MPRPLTLALNGQLVDLPPTTKGLIRLSQARAVLADLAARIGEYSFPLTLPPTRRNAAVLGVDKLHPLALGKFGPATDFAYELRVAGAVFAGTFRLTSLKNGYTGSLLGAGFSWALLLGDKKLGELSLPAVAYDGSQLEAVQQLTCEQTDMQFPLVAYGNFFAPPVNETQRDGSTKEVPAPAAAVLDYPLSVDDYPPGVYLVNVLRRIFADVGWHLQGRELDSDFWRAVLLLPTGGADLAAAWPWGALLPAAASSGGGRPNAYSYYESDPLGTGSGYSNTAAGFDQTNEIFYLPVPARTVLSAPTRALNPLDTSYTAPRAGVYSFAWATTLAQLRQTLTGNPSFFNTPLADGFRAVGLGLVLRRGGQSFESADGGLCRPGGGGQFAAGQDRVLTPRVVRTQTALGLSDGPGGSFSGAGDVFLEAGDELRLCLFAQRGLTDNNQNRLFSRKEFYVEFTGISFACTAYADNDGLSKTSLRPADFLPALTQRDLVKDFLTRVNGFIVADPAARVATIVSRDELAAAAGQAIDLSERLDQRAIDYLPALAAGIGRISFAPAAPGGDPLVALNADKLTAQVGPGEQAQAVGSLFAPVGFRPVFVAGVAGPVPLPTCSTKDILAQSRTETAPDPKAQAPRLLRYVGPDASRPVPFMQRTVPLGVAAWDGALAWDGERGAVATYYQATLRRAVRGHLARVQVPLTPALYQGLTPGRRVELFGAAYTVESLTNYDPSDEGSQAQLDLSREVD